LTIAFNCMGTRSKGTRLVRSAIPRFNLICGKFTRVLQRTKIKPEDRPLRLATPRISLATPALFSLFGAAACILPVANAPAFARASESLAVATPFEVGESPAGNYLAAIVAGAERDTAAAATFSREALRFDPRNPELIERAFVAAVSNGNMNEAFGLADRLLTRDPSNGLARLVLGIKALKAKQFAGARAQFNGGNGPQRDLTSILLSAWCYQGSGDTKKAFDLADRLREDNFAVFRDYHKALIADVANDAAEATKRFKAAYENDKNTLRLVDAYARFMARHGNQMEAIRAYEAFDQVLPNHPIVVAALADLRSGKTLDPLVKTPEQGAAEVLFGLGAVGSRQGDEAAALIYLRLSLFLNPQNGLAVLTLGDIYEHLKQNEQAIDIYQMIPDSDPLRSTADIQIGQLLETLGRSAEATKILKQTVADHPKDEDALSALGNLQRSRKQFGEAAETYSRALAESTKPAKADWPLYYFRGISYEREKKWPQAEGDFKHALELFPEQPLVLNYLGYSWVDHGTHLDEAFTMLHRAVELRPTDGYIVDSLGWANYKLGRYDEAVKELERAIDLKPSDPVINDHLGDAYWRIGRKLEAHFQWNHARDLSPEPEDLPRILSKIEHGLSDDDKPATTEPQPTHGEATPDQDKPAAADVPSDKNGG
jgi:tetratricopeptide (TPR) repeat protein